MLDKGLGIEKAVVNNWTAMKKYDPAGRIKLVIDEWGVWYARSPEIAPGFNLAQTVTLRDAVHTAMHFDIFNRHADKIAMANVAQTINCLHSLFLAHEDKCARTPVYHLFDMYKAHMGARLVPVRNRAGTESIHQALSCSASILEKRLTVTLTNPSVSAPRTVRLKIGGALRPTEGRGRALTHEAMNATNTFARPDEVHPVTLDVKVGGDSVSLMLPRKPVAALSIQLA